MDEGHFYFLNDQYFLDFASNNKTLMGNKETTNGSSHDRPCFCAFKDNKSSLFWMIPISSQVSKFKTIYTKKVAKYGRCDTIVFGDVLGTEKAFLIQNMCPVTNAYIKNEYIHCGVPVQLDNRLFNDLQQKASKVLALQRKGHKLIFPDVLSIEHDLLST